MVDFIEGLWEVHSFVFFIVTMTLLVVGNIILWSLSRRDEYDTMVSCMAYSCMVLFGLMMILCLSARLDSLIEGIHLAGQ